MTLILFSAIMGWCGTPFPGWWWIIRRKKPPIPDPPPYRMFSDPMPGICAIIGGIAGGYLAHWALPQESYATFGLAALAGGRILSDIAGGILASMR